MFEFRTQYDFLKVNSQPGRPEHPEYQMRVDKDGHEYLEQIGMIDTDAQIQSWKDSTDINVILARYANGEVDVLSQRQGMYIDATKLPGSFSEMLDSLVRGEQLFYQLPPDVREKFNNNFSEWVASMDNITDWNLKMGLVKSHGSDPASVNVSSDNKEVS